MPGCASTGWSASLGCSPANAGCDERSGNETPRAATRPR
jgi:hypothetical protein